MRLMATAKSYRFMRLGRILLNISPDSRFTRTIQILIGLFGYFYKQLSITLRAVQPKTRCILIPDSVESYFEYERKKEREREESETIRLISA